jgi:hypothetical protein
MDFPPGHLTFGSWQEMGTEIHVTFLTFARVSPAHCRLRPKPVLRWAWYPNEHASHENGYHSGLAAYDAWIKAVEDGMAAVTQLVERPRSGPECRRFAARYAGELAEALRRRPPMPRTLKPVTWRSPAIWPG